MFPKKRKQKEHHLAPSKASRMDNSPTSPTSPTSPSYTNYTFGDELNIPSPPSSQSSKTPLKNYEQDWRDIEDIINRPSSPPSSPTIPLDVLTPILKDLDPTGRLSSRSPKTPIKSYNQDWTDLEDIMNRPSSPPSSPTIPLDVLTPILKDLDPLNNQSPPNLSPINNQLHLSLNEYNSVFTPSPPHLSPPYPSYHPYPLYPLYPPSTPSTPSTPSPPSPPSPPYPPSPLPDSESEDQDEDISMTSDDIFQIMMYLSDCKRDITPIDRNHILLNKILTEVLENQILAFNVTINNIISAKSNRDGPLDENTRKKQHAGNVNSLRLNLNRMYNNIKHKHNKIYPAAQILELINPEDPNIIFMNILEHEVDLKQELLKLKNQLESHKRRLIITPTYQNIRRHKLRPLIQILRAKFIGLYKL